MVGDDRDGTAWIGVGPVGRLLDFLARFRRIDHGVAAYAGHVTDRIEVEALELAAVHRALKECSVEHAGQPNVHPVDGRAVDDGANMQAGRTLLRQYSPFFATLELRLLCQLDGAGQCGELAITRFALCRGMRKHTFASNDFVQRHVPARGGGEAQALSRARASLQHRLHDPWLRASARERRPDARLLDVNVFARVSSEGHRFDTDLVPITLQLFGDEHRCLRGVAGAGFGCGHPNGDGVIGSDDDPWIDLGRRGRGLRRRVRTRQDGEREAAGNGGGRDDELAP